MTKPPPLPRRSRTRSPRFTVQEGASGTTGRRSFRISKSPPRKGRQNQNHSLARLSDGHNPSDDDNHPDTNIPSDEEASSTEPFPEPDEDIDRGSSAEPDSDPERGRARPSKSLHSTRYENNRCSDQCENTIPQPLFTNNPWFRYPSLGRTVPGVALPGRRISAETFHLDQWEPLDIRRPFGSETACCENMGTHARPLLPCLSRRIFLAQPFNRATLPDREGRL